MSTIEDHQSKMTVFYSKSNGAIKNIATGIHDMNFFADEKDDLSIIWSFAVVPYDKFVLYNANHFIYDLNSLELKLKDDSELMKYKIIR